MLAIRRVAHAPVHRVAHRPGNGRWCRAGQPERYVVFLQVVPQLLIGDAGLHQRRAQHRVDLDDLVHVLEVEHDLPARAGRGRAIAEVPAGRDRPDRRLELVADLQDPLHFLDGRREDRGARPVLLVRRGHHDLAIGSELLVAGEHAIGAEQAAQLGKRRLELLRGDALGQGLLGLVSHGLASGSLGRLGSGRLGCGHHLGHAIERLVVDHGLGEGRHRAVPCRWRRGRPPCPSPAMRRRR